MAMVLVIDDEVDVARMIQDMLQSAGHQVVSAYDGEDGIGLLRAFPVELVITDILMPKRDGLETIRVARKGAPDLPIVAISGGGQTGQMNYLQEAVEFGADATLKKPFGRDELLRTVDGLLSGHSVDS